jgi:hypothetical protein
VRSERNEDQNDQGGTPLHWAFARTYDSHAIAFTSPDPLPGDPMRPLSTNRYRAFSADPVQIIDWYGLSDDLYPTNASGDNDTSRSWRPINPDFLKFLEGFGIVAAGVVGGKLVYDFTRGHGGVVGGAPGVPAGPALGLARGAGGIISAVSEILNATGAVKPPKPALPPLPKAPAAPVWEAPTPSEPFAVESLETKELERLESTAVEITGVGPAMASAPPPADPLGLNRALESLVDAVLKVLRDLSPCGGNTGIRCVGGIPPGPAGPLHVSPDMARQAKEVAEAVAEAYNPCANVPPGVVCAAAPPIFPQAGPLANAVRGAAKAGTLLTKDSIIEGFKVSNHAWRKSGLGRGATEELVSGVIQGARKAGTVVSEVGTGKFAGNTIEVFVHDGVKVVVDTSRNIIMSIRPVSNSAFKLP